jgi:hypothetical protein
MKLGATYGAESSYDLYAESPSGAEGPAKAVALLDNMYDVYQFK